MRFYTQQRRFYCGIDLTARTIFDCIHDQADDKFVHQEIRANPEAFLSVLAPFHDNFATLRLWQTAWG